MYSVFGVPSNVPVMMRTQLQTRQWREHLMRSTQTCQTAMPMLMYTSCHFWQDCGGGCVSLTICIHRQQGQP